MGFPDVSKQALRGGSVFAEKMDPMTLSVVLDKMVADRVQNDDLWNQLCWRAQNLAHKAVEPDLGYIYRAHAQAGWFDQHFVTTYLGRLQRRLPHFQLRDVGILFEAFGNPLFYHEETMRQLRNHAEALLTHRDDHTAEDLAYFLVAMKRMGVAEISLASLAASALVKKDTSASLSDSLKCRVIGALSEQLLEAPASAKADITLAPSIWAIVDDCDSSRIDALSVEDAVDLLSSLALLPHAETRAASLIDACVALLTERRHQASHNPSLLARAALGAARLHRYDHRLFEQLNLGLAEFTAVDNSLSAGSLCAAWTGFVRANKQMPFAYGKLLAAIRGAAGDVSVHDAVVLLEGFARVRGAPAPPAEQANLDEIFGLAFYLVEERLSSLHAHEIASLCRSLYTLNPETGEGFIPAVMKRAVELAPSMTPAQRVDVLAGLSQNMTSVKDKETLLEPLLASLVRDVSALTAKDASTLLATIADAPFEAKLLPVALSCVEIAVQVLLEEAHVLPARALVRLLDILADLVVNTQTGEVDEVNFSEATRRQLASEVSALLDARRYDLFETGDATLVTAAASMRRLGLVPHLFLGAESNTTMLRVRRGHADGAPAADALEPLRARRVWMHDFSLRYSASAVSETEASEELAVPEAIRKM